VSIYAVGDIHGNLTLLDGLLDQLVISSEDTLVFLGDYVDRGPDSRGVIERLIGLRETMGDRSVCLLGNHDEMFVDYWRQTRGPWTEQDSLDARFQEIAEYGPNAFLTFGGKATLDSYNGDVPRTHIDFLLSLPLRHDQDGYAFVHAGLRPNAETTRAEMLWGAQGFWGEIDRITGRQIPADFNELGKTVVVGHAAFDEPQLRPGIIAIDTGCGVGGALTAVQLPEIRIYREPDAGFVFGL
jgi:serine/threonine protein phosphatase 1